MQETRCLVIGYGNTLRSDDGAGQRIAETVATWNLKQVQALSVHQLTPELAEPLSTAGSVIFVDAYPATDDTPHIQIIELTPPNFLEPGKLGHTADPRSLLALTQQVYGLTPSGWWVLVPAVNFEFGEQFSPVTQRGIAEALEQIKQLVVAAGKYAGLPRHGGPTECYYSGNLIEDVVWGRGAPPHNTDV